jgi:hypothetical protein
VKALAWRSRIITIVNGGPFQRVRSHGLGNLGLQRVDGGTYPKPIETCLTESTGPTAAAGIQFPFEVARHFAGW